MKLRIPESWRPSEREPMKPRELFERYLQDLGIGEPRGAVETVQDDVTRMRECFARLLVVLFEQGLDTKQLAFILGSKEIEIVETSP
jgi:hypothetical protein